MKSLSCPSRRCSRSRKSAARSIIRHGFYTLLCGKGAKLLSVVHGPRDGSLQRWDGSEFIRHAGQWNSGWNVASRQKRLLRPFHQRRSRSVASSLSVPKVAVYKGKGNTNDAANFVCRDPDVTAGLSLFSSQVRATLPFFRFSGQRGRSCLGEGNCSYSMRTSQKTLSCFDQLKLWLRFCVGGTQSFLNHRQSKSPAVLCR